MTPAVSFFAFREKIVCPVYYDKKMLNQVICLNKN